MARAGGLDDTPAKKRQRTAHEKAEEDPPRDDAALVESSESEAVEEPYAGARTGPAPPIPEDSDPLSLRPGRADSAGRGKEKPFQSLL
eukprot:969263-Pyramimonas_sp.AAC.1